MCEEGIHFSLRWQQRSAAWYLALVTEGHLSQESGGKTCMVGHGINTKKMKLFISDPHLPINTLCSLQIEVVLPKAKEAYDLGPGRDLVISTHCHMFLWNLKNQLFEPQMVETTISFPCQLPFCHFPLVGWCWSSCDSFFWIWLRRRWLLNTFSLGPVGYVSGGCVVIASHLVEEYYPGTLLLCSLTWAHDSEGEAASTDACFKGLALQVCE